jgi:glutamate-5-semialdehyde dehydrogenase
MIYTTLEELAAAAKTATFKMAMASSTQKNAALEVLVENLKKHREIILQANRQDKALAQADGLSTALYP